MYINCLWVSGQFKGQGYSNLLLEECIRDSREKGRLGLVVLTSKKKMPYLSDPKFLGYKGFIRADTPNRILNFSICPLRRMCQNRSLRSR